MQTDVRVGLLKPKKRLSSLRNVTSLLNTCYVTDHWLIALMRSMIYTSMQLFLFNTDLRDILNHLLVLSRLQTLVLLRSTDR